MATALERFGGVHVLVNNAGIGHTATIAKHTVADYERVVAVNQTGVFLGMRSVVAPMTDGGGGSIVNISSGAGLRATKYMIAYAATKYAVTGMTAAGALELARYGIRVNSIHPGVVDTPMLGDSFDANSNAIVHNTPLRRMAQPGRDRQRRAVPGVRRVVVHDRRPRPGGRRHHRLTPVERLSGCRRGGGRGIVRARRAPRAGRRRRRCAA